MNYKLESFQHRCKYKGIEMFAVLETTQRRETYVDVFCFFPLKRRSKRIKIKAV